MAEDVADWLRRLGLEQCAPAFAANDIDAGVLPELTAHDLLGIGITSIGHRRKLAGGNRRSSRSRHVGSTRTPAYVIAPYLLFLQ